MGGLDMKKFRKLASLIGGILLVALAAYAVYAWFVVERESNIVTVDVGAPIYEREFISATTGDGFLPGETISFGSQIRHKNSGNRDVIAALDFNYELTVDAVTGDISGFYAKFDASKLAANGYEVDAIVAEFPNDYQLIGTDLYMTQNRFEDLFYLFMPLPDNENWIRPKDASGLDGNVYLLRVKAGDSTDDNEKILGVTGDLGGRASLPDGTRTANRAFEQFITVIYKKQSKTSQPSVKAFKSVFGEEVYAAVESAGYGLKNSDNTDNANSWFNFD
jgi:hypothetical protein